MKKQIRKILCVALSLCLILSLALTANATNFVKDFNEDGSIPETVQPVGKKMLKLEAVNGNTDEWMDKQTVSSQTIWSRLGWFFAGKNGETYTISYKYKSSSDAAHNSNVSNSYFDIQRTGVYSRLSNLTDVTCVMNDEGIYEYSAKFSCTEDYEFFAGISFKKPDTVYIADFTVTDSTGASVIDNSDFYNNLKGMTAKTSSSDYTNLATENDTTYTVYNGGQDYVTATLLDYNQSDLVSKKMLHFTDSASNHDYLHTDAFSLEAGATYAVYFKYKSASGMLNPGSVNKNYNSNYTWLFIINRNNKSYGRWNSATETFDISQSNNAFDTMSLNNDGYTSFYGTFVADSGFNDSYDTQKFWCGFQHRNYTQNGNVENDVYIADFKLVKLGANGSEEVIVDGVDKFTKVESAGTSGMNYGLETYDDSMFSTQPTKMYEFDAKATNKYLGFRTKLVAGNNYNISFLYRSENDTSISDYNAVGDDFWVRLNRTTYNMFDTSKQDLSISDLSDTGWRRVNFNYTLAGNSGQEYECYLQFAAVTDATKFYISDVKISRADYTTAQNYTTENIGICAMAAGATGYTNFNVVGTDAGATYTNSDFTLTLKDFDEDLFRTKLDEVYVSDNGKDSNDGTEASPFATVDKAMKSVAENGKIIIKDTLTYAGNDYNGAPVISGGTVKAAARQFNLRGDLTLENTVLNIAGNIITNGKNLAIGEKVTYTNDAPIIQTNGGETISFATKKYDNSIICGEDTTINAKGWIMLQNADKTYYVGNGTANIATAGAYKFLNSPDVNDDSSLNDTDVTVVRTGLLNDTIDNKYDMNDDTNIDICDLVRLYKVVSTVSE